MGDEKLVVKGVGMVSSVGVTALQSLASIDSGINRKSLMPDIYYTLPEDLLFDERSELIAAPLSFLESRRNDFPEPSTWLAFVAEKAFADLMESTDFEEDEDPLTGLFLSLPPLLEDKDPFVTLFHNRIEKDIYPVEDYCFEGHTGVFSMMEKARLALAKGEINRAIVGGVESSLFPEWLEKLDNDYRLKSRRAMDGYIPGEAAAFIWLETERKNNKKERLAVVNGIFRAMDSMKNSTPASALTDVVSRCLDLVPKPPAVYGDLNGQSKRMDEWGYVETRLGERLGNPVVLRHPADRLGDMGAASGAVLAIIAMHELHKKTNDHDSALIFTASDQGNRAAVLLSR